MRPNRGGSCPCCRKTVRRRWGKHTSKHTCPHGKPCWAGDKRAAGGGWNPGGIQHRVHCEDCALEVEACKGCAACGCFISTPKSICWSSGKPHGEGENVT